MAASDLKPPSGLPRDLMPRVVAGLVLAAGTLFLTWLSQWTYGLFVMAVGLIVAWEWGRMVRKVELDAVLVIHLVGVVAAGLLALFGLPLLGLIAAIIGAILVGILGFDKLGRVSALGVLYAALPVIALIWIRMSPHLGVEASLFLLLCVWAADTGAYFAGRSIGGPKLMPRISPNKTWSGALGGIAASLVIAVCFKLILPSLGLGLLLASALLIAVVSQAGDLAESALKRRYSVKDASGLIPGHGGFMDRVDGLIFAAIGAAVFAIVVNIHAPGQAILSWQ